MNKPLIGVTPGLNEEESRLLVHRGTIDALRREGALPVILPLTDDEGEIAEIVDRFDGFVFTGGGDIDPELYRQNQLACCGAISPQRDSFELPLARMLAVRRDKPVLAICRGFQVLNVALGGDLYQDIGTQYHGEALAHRQHQPDCYASHPVIVTMSSLLDQAVHTQKLWVNSLHHQAVKRLAPALESCGAAPDGIIEAASLTGHPFFLGVQWHPERMWQRDDTARAIFTAFVEACEEAAR